MESLTHLVTAIWMYVAPVNARSSKRINKGVDIIIDIVYVTNIVGSAGCK